MKGDERMSANPEPSDFSGYAMAAIMPYLSNYGIRPADILNLKDSDIDRQHQTISIEHREIKPINLSCLRAILLRMLQKEAEDIWPEIPSKRLYKIIKKAQPPCSITGIFKQDIRSEYIIEQIEIAIVSETPLKDLPLLIAELKSEKARTILANRLQKMD
jgi:hypothetical protein